MKSENKVRLSRGIAVLVCGAMAACGAFPPRIVADGIRCEQRVAGKRPPPMLIAFAGWKVTQIDASQWARALAEAGYSSDASAQVCAARGPQDATYRSKDIDTGAFAQSLAEAMGARRDVGEIYVVAHSSGSFVAQHFLQQLRESGGATLLARMRYTNLDGAVGEGERAIDADMIKALASVRAVYAIDPHTGSESANASSMRRLHALSPERVKLIALPVPAAGCLPGAKWCLHIALINRKPYDPANFDVKRDYGGINAAHPVEASYLRSEN